MKIKKLLKYVNECIAFIMFFEKIRNCNMMMCKYVIIRIR